MDLLVTVIGNAAADPEFRARLLDNPRKTVDDYGFRLTKGEVELLTMIFTPSMKADLDRNFGLLQGTLYKPLIDGGVCHNPPCRFSVATPMAKAA
jgi:hypothetical protein